MTKKKKKGLGRGLATLIGDVDGVVDPDLENKIVSKSLDNDTNDIPIEFLHPNKNQPRKSFNEETIDELSQSIKQKGLILPILVKKIDLENYQIIAGERRWRAAQKAGLHNVPVIIKDLSDNEILEIALIENMQREDLNPIEEAMGMAKLQKDHNYTQEQLSEILGKSRPQIANTLRLLNLPHKVQEFVQNKSLSAGHARALIGLDNAFFVAKYAIKKEMNVRQLENYIAYVKKQKVSKKSKDPNILSLEKDLNNILGLTIKISHNKNEKGNIQIFYDNLDQLNDLIRNFKK